MQSNKQQALEWLDSLQTPCTLTAELKEAVIAAVEEIPEKFSFQEYQALAKTTAIYPEGSRVVYPTLGLCGETGEIAEKIKKHIRDGKELDKEDLKKELGDVLWYLSALAGDLGIDLQDVALTNYLKLKSRKERNVIQGSGDNR